jgi:UDP-N-acetyl-D-mannosaminuronate dehydrogenase
MKNQEVLDRVEEVRNMIYNGLNKSVEDKDSYRSLNEVVLLLDHELSRLEYDIKQISYENNMNIDSKRLLSKLKEEKK